jgi:DNA-binding CsgD family transcriptional regulator
MLTIDGGTVRDRSSRLIDFANKANADDRFLAELSRQLRLLIPFDGAFITAADPVTGLAVAPARIENLGDDSTCAAYWNAEFMADDYVPFRTLARSRHPAASLFRATDGRMERSVRYRTVNRVLGYHDELRTVFRSDDATWGFASFWRRDARHPFTVSEERLLAMLSVHIASAFRRTALVRAETDAPSPQAPGLLMFDETGELEALNEPAEAWLAELPGPRFTPGTPCTLPTAVLTVSARARAIAAGVERETNEHGAARARIHTRSGRWLVVHGSALRGPHAAPGRIALIIEPARASEIAPIIVEAYQLTQREQESTKLISYGCATDEIATRLALSRHTVRDYIKLIFEKVGVGSRGELVARIFAEHYAEPFHERLVYEDVAADLPA